MFASPNRYFTENLSLGAPETVLLKNKSDHWISFSMNFSSIFIVICSQPTV